MEKHENRSITEPAKTLPVCAEVDVAVIGAGSAGIVAALAAAEDGLKVTLVEGRSFAGTTRFPPRSKTNSSFICA